PELSTMRFRPDPARRRAVASPGPDGELATPDATAPAAASPVVVHQLRSQGATGVVIALALVAVATTVYLSPTSGLRHGAALQGSPAHTPTRSANATGLPTLVPDGSQSGSSSASGHGSGSHANPS